MRTWVVGDVHGCMETFQALLRRLDWEAGSDRLVLVGDLVNRGPDSLAVLRWCVAHAGRVEAVLGNHDLHLLARAGGRTQPREEDRFDEVLEAHDRGELIRWLGTRPLLVDLGSAVVVHAGVWPGWTRERAVEEARRGEAIIRRSGGLGFLAEHRKIAWEENLAGDGRAAAAVWLFTRLRMVHADGRPRYGYTGAPAAAPNGSRPWFEQAAMCAAGPPVVFGHWAMLGLRRLPGALCLDGGCVYGGHLAAWSPEEDRLVLESSAPGDRWPGE